MGRTNYHAGLAAEDIVSNRYRSEGYAPRGHRWRGPGGEIDLIFEKLGTLVFVEVKKSRDFASAAARITERQLARIAASASAFLATMPEGQMTDMRIDAALVDASGRVEIVENCYVA